MDLRSYFLFTLALISLAPHTAVAATKLTIDHSTINPRIGEVNVEDLIDNRYIRRLDESGFFERIYGK